MSGGSKMGPGPQSLHLELGPSVPHAASRRCQGSLGMPEVEAKLLPPKNGTCGSILILPCPCRVNVSGCISTTYVGGSGTSTFDAVEGKTCKTSASGSSHCSSAPTPTQPGPWVEKCTQPAASRTRCRLTVRLFSSTAAG